MGEFYNGLYIADRITEEIPKQIKDMHERIKPTIGTVLMVIWVVTKSRKKRAVSVGVVDFIGERFMTLSQPRYSASGKRYGESSFSVAFSDLLCGEVRVIRLGQENTTK